MKRLTFIICCYLFIVARGEASVLLDRVIAIVDKEVITWSELYKAMIFEFESKIRGLAQEERKSFLESRQDDFLERLINMRLMIDEAEKKGFKVADAEVLSAIDNIRNNYDLSEEQFKLALKREGFEYNDYYKRIGEQILIGKVVNAEVHAKIIISEEEVDEYMQEHRDELPLSESYRLSQIQVRKPETFEEKQEIERILDVVNKDIENAVPFNEIIKKLSGNPYTLFAGDTGFIMAKNLRDDIRKTVETLEEGKISSPVFARDGIFIVKVEKKELPAELEVIRDNILKLLIDNKSKKSYEKWVDRLRRRAFIEIKL